MQHDFDFKGAAELPYNPKNYNLPIWRDEDHQPPEAVAEQEPQTAEIMSTEEAKCKLCSWAMSQVGYHEGENNWQKYAENTDLQAMYGWKPQNQPWCDVFVDSAFISCFGLAAACAMTYQRMGEGSALCRQSAQYYMDHDAWIPRGKTPEIGDQVFFYASGDINHTGIVVRVDGGSVHTVEGNSSDMVAERVYSVSDSKIAGYGRPDWAVVEGEQFEGIKDYGVGVEPGEPGIVEEPRYYELRFPYLQRGSMGASVSGVQRALRIFVDGEFGDDTEAAVLHFQRNHALNPDGVVGPLTAAALFGGEVYTPPVTTAETKEEPKADSFWNNLLTKIRRS